MKVIIVDSAQAWVVTMGCFIINSLMIGVMKVFSLIIIEYQDMLEAPMSLLLLGMCLMTSIGLAAPLSSYLSEKITSRKLATLSSLLSTAALLLLAFAYHIYMYLISTILLGLSFSFIFIPTFSIPGKCHTKHQTLSQGIISSGASLGTLILPLIFTQLICTYSIRGYVMILAGLLLNFSVGALLMPTHIVSVSNPRKPVLLMCQEQHGDEEKCKKLGKLKIYGHTSFRNVSKIWPPRPLWPSIAIISFGMGLIMNGYMILAGLYGAFANSFNIDIITAAYILMGHSCLEFITRVLVGFIVDIKICRGYHIYFISAITLSGISIVTSLVPIISLFYIYVAVNAIVGSVLVVLQILILSDVVEINYLSITFSIYIFIQGSMGIPSYYGIGKICDITGSINYGICIAGGFLFFGAILICIESCIRKS